MRIFKIIFWFFKDLPNWFDVLIRNPFIYWLERRKIQKQYKAQAKENRRIERNRYVQPIPKVTRQKPGWRTGMPSAPGKYIVRHKGKMREVIFKYMSFGFYDFLCGFVVDHRDTVPMKGITGWYPAPINLMQIN